MIFTSPPLANSSSAQKQTFLRLTLALPLLYGVKNVKLVIT